MTQNMLQLNSDKTEIILFGTSQQLSKLEGLTFNSAGDIIIPNPCVRNLGVLFDNNLSMKHHISEVCRLSFYHLRNIAHIRRYLTFDAARTIIQALVCSRIDWNNSLYYGLPNTQLQRLQRVQNAAARIIMMRRKFDHVTPILKELHWLPVTSRVLFKMLVLAYKCVHGDAPSYLSDLITHKVNSSFNLRSNYVPLLLQPRRTNLVYGGDRAFCAAAPREWNNLPLRIRTSESIVVFKSQLKTYLFIKSYFT